MFQIEQKLCKGTKSVLLWHIMVQNRRVCLVWPFVALCGLFLWSPYSQIFDLIYLVWLCVALYGLFWPFSAFLVLCNLVWPCTALCGLFCGRYIAKYLVLFTLYFVILDPERKKVKSDAKKDQ